MAVYRSFLGKLSLDNNSAIPAGKWLEIAKKGKTLSESFVALTLMVGPEPWMDLGREETATRILFYLLRQEALVEINYVPYSHMVLIYGGQRHFLDSRIPIKNRFPTLILDADGLSKLDQIILGKVYEGVGDTFMDRMYRIINGLPDTAIGNIQSLAPEDFVVMAPWIIETLKTLVVPMLSEVKAQILALLDKGRKEFEYGWFNPQYDLIFDIVSKYPDLVGKSRSSSPISEIAKIETDIVELGLPSDSPRKILTQIPPGTITKSIVIKPTGWTPTPTPILSPESEKARGLQKVLMAEGYSLNVPLITRK